MFFIHFRNRENDEYVDIVEADDEVSRYLN
jgi:hypothetical protein